jgi:hypothetical protein
MAFYSGMPCGRWHEVSDAATNPQSPKVNSQSIEAALLYLDVIARQGLIADPETRKNLDGLKERICRDLNAARDYKKLTAEGCDGDLLLWYLAALSEHASPVVRGWLDRPGPQSLSQLTGLTSRQFKALKKKLLDTATEIEGINHRFDFGILLHTPHLKFFQPLPGLLRGYVSLLTLASEQIGRGTHVYHNFAKASLIAHVRQRTSRYYDGPLSRLIAAVSGQGASYGEVEHHNWRNQHSNLIVFLQS